VLLHDLGHDPAEVMTAPGRPEMAR
jgi:hypothetical protein